MSISRLRVGVVQNKARQDVGIYNIVNVKIDFQANHRTKQHKFELGAKGTDNKTVMGEEFTSFDFLAYAQDFLLFLRCTGWLSDLPSPILTAIAKD